MTATIDFGDGTKVELSQETTNRLRAELIKPLPPDHNQLKVDIFRAVLSPSGLGFRIAMMKEADDVWNGEWLGSNVSNATYFRNSEVRDIIDGLTKMLKR